MVFLASMALLPHLNKVLSYSDQFDYPLTIDEIWFWQIGTSFSKQRILSNLKHSSLDTKHSYYYLPGRSKIIHLRQNREQASQEKWTIATRVAKSLSRLPTIEAIFVTGALAMNNSPENDDIDLMIITRPHTLWLTRLIVYFFLGRRRRPSSLPEHSSPRVANTICDNLYLDSDHLHIREHSLYVAHEILQAKPAFDRTEVTSKFILANPWVNDYLPIAYSESLKKLSLPEYGSKNLLSYFLAPFNLFAFACQYLFMKSKITSERISLHMAFFHPHQHAS